ncbi:MAG: zinc-dependent metalloprotease [candidate division Zixibacteria bacterium]|nr:zinc-dependent metalloprotease [candidate division Zixibacteria bacterium]
MQLRRIFEITLVAITLLAFVGNVDAKRRVRTFGDKEKSSETTKNKKDTKKTDEKPFAEMIKDKVAIEGLFTFYHDTIDNSYLMAVKPEQFGPIYLLGLTRSASEGAYFDNGTMSSTFPFFFKRVGKKIMLMEKNLRFRADESSPLKRALDRAVSDHLRSSTTVASKPDDSTGAILVKPAEFFLKDITNIGYYMNRGLKTGLSFDKGNSYFETVKGFPENTEIDVRLHFKTSKPISASTMQNPYSMFHVYHYSLSSLPETDYMPRLADDRIGHFQTIYQDYTNLDEETPYVRYVERWHLKKKDPTAALSEPVEPIVFWVENTVPEEYRPAVVDAIEFWNPAFEKIGFKNALVAKQMPDTADWDPADTRYNVVRWMIIPGGSYAVGPSRANPFTGQIYDADIRFSSDWVRYMYNRMEYFIDPVSFDGSTPGETGFDEVAPELEGINNYRMCNYGAEAAKEAAFASAYLSVATDDLADKDEAIKKYVRTYITEILAHEVGHTLGLRHNFKASSVYTLDQINDTEFAREHGTICSIMDYGPPNIAGPGRVQGDFYSTIPGAYDDWMVEYAYSEFDAATPKEELPMLAVIAGKAAKPELAYGTDEDAFGWSTRSVDPYCNLHDAGNDPLGFALHRISLTRELWHNSIPTFEKPGARYQKLYGAFLAGWRSYGELALIAPKYVGGITRNNLHVGDAPGKPPFEVVPASDQRRAVAALRDHLFAANVFDLPDGLLNKLQPERFPDFAFSVYGRSVDYPFHQRVLAAQNTALARLYSSAVIGRLLNNVDRFGADEDKYTMHDMFTEVRRAIWSEVTGPANVNSFRRQLQLAHLTRIIGIYLSLPSQYPSDARTLAANDLDILSRAARSAAGAGNLNAMSRAHYKEVVRQIEAASNASHYYGSSVIRR